MVFTQREKKKHFWATGCLLDRRKDGYWVNLFRIHRLKSYFRRKKANSQLSQSVLLVIPCRFFKVYTWHMCLVWNHSSKKGLRHSEDVTGCLLPARCRLGFSFGMLHMMWVVCIVLFLPFTEMRWEKIKSRRMIENREYRDCDGSINVNTSNASGSLVQACPLSRWVICGW